MALADVLRKKGKKKDLTVLPRDLWRTPDWLYLPLYQEFRFEIDAAADRENAKCPQYYTKENSAFNNPWFRPTFCNPPYSVEAGGTLMWCERAYEEAQEHYQPSVLVVQGDTSTKYRAFAMRHASEIRDLTHRVKFIGAPGSPPFPTAIYIFRPVQKRFVGGANVTLWNYRPTKNISENAKIVIDEAA